MSDEESNFVDRNNPFEMPKMNVRAIISIPMMTSLSCIICKYYSHDQINSVFFDNNVPENAASFGKREKLSAWFKLCNDDFSIDPLKSLGEALMNIMELYGNKREKEEILKILKMNGLNYQNGGKINKLYENVSSNSLREALKSRNLPEVETEFSRALDNIESDPPTSLTAACSIVESLCKLYIEDQGLSLPKDQTIKPLWNVIKNNLGFIPNTLIDDDLKKILSGLNSIVDGIGALRTHGGSAHGRGQKKYKIGVRHSRLAINAAYTICCFIIETWNERQPQKM